MIHILYNKNILTILKLNTREILVAYVSEIYICKVKKQPRIEIESGFFIENFGLEGDIYSKMGTEKQVTLFFDESRDLLEKEPYSGLCFSRFLETIRIGGMGAENLMAGTEIQIGDAVFIVSNKKKKCYPECRIIQDKRVCALSKDVRFCKVLRSGNISRGDNIKLLN